MSAPQYEEKRERINNEYTNNKLIYDEHSLTIEPFGIAHSKVEEIFSEAIRNIPINASITEWKNDEHYHLFWPTDKSGKRKGNARVFIKSLAMWNCMVGRNPDGTTRSRSDLTPELRAQYDKENKVMEAARGDWCDDTDSEYKFVEKWSKIWHLVKTSGYVFIPEARYFDAEKIRQPDEIVVMRGYAKAGWGGINLRQLTVKGVPPGKTHLLQSLFSYYNTSQNKDYPQCKEVGGKYPQYVLDFDPKTHDAIFAFMMTLGRTIKIAGLHERVLLIVNYPKE